MEEDRLVGDGTEVGWKMRELITGLIHWPGQHELDRGS